MHLTHVDGPQPGSLKGDDVDSYSMVDETTELPHPGHRRAAAGSGARGAQARCRAEHPRRRGAPDPVRALHPGPGAGERGGLVRRRRPVQRLLGESTALGFADAVYGTVRQGAERTTSDGQQVTLKIREHHPQPPHRCHAGAARHLEPLHSALVGLLRLHPAAYAQRSSGPELRQLRPGRIARATGLDMRYIVIHDTEGSYDSTPAVFQNPTYGAAAHYVVRAGDGHVAQMCRTRTSPGTPATGTSTPRDRHRARGRRDRRRRLVHASRCTGRLGPAGALPGPAVQRPARPRAHHRPRQRARRTCDHQRACTGIRAPSGTGTTTWNCSGADPEQREPPTPDRQHRPGLSDQHPPADLLLRPDRLPGRAHQPANFVYLYTAPSTSAPLITNPFITDTPRGRTTGPTRRRPASSTPWPPTRATGTQSGSAARRPGSTARATSTRAEGSACS